MSELASLFAQMDAAVLAVIAAVVAALALTRRGRPITKSRVMDVALSSILFVFLGVRYAIMAFATVVSPAAVFPGASADLASVMFGFYCAVSVVGFLTYRGGVGVRALGATVLAAITIGEVLLNTIALKETLATDIDTVLSVAIAALAGVLAAFFWTYRTAIPNPLGSDKRPFDY